MGGHEGHEDEAGFCHRQRSTCSRSCFCWKKAKDDEWTDKRQTYEEQDGKNRVQEAISCGQAPVCQRTRPMDKGCRCCSKGLGSYWFRCSQWQDCTGKGHLREGKSYLFSSQVKIGHLFFGDGSHHSIVAIHVELLAGCLDPDRLCALYTPRA